jgi:hypothetical protein
MPVFDENLNRALRMRNVFGAPVADAMAGPNVMTGWEAGIPDQQGLSLGFNPPDQQQQMQPDMQPQQQGRLQELYQPEDRAINMLYDMISNMPERNQPGIGRKVLASIIGLGAGPEGAEQAMYAPYLQQMADWKTKLEPVQTAANLERQSNVNMRQLAQSQAAEERRMLALKESERAAREREENNRIRTESYVALNRFRTENPDWDIVKQEGGNYVLINPKTGETKDSGVPTGTMSQVDEINLRIEGAVRAAATPRTSFVTTSGQTTSTTTPGALSPQERRAALYNRALELYNSEPRFRPFIDLLGDNEFEIREPRDPGWIREGRSQDDWNELQRRMAEPIEQGPPRTTVTDRSGESATVSQRGGAVTPPPTSNRVPVIGPNGETGTVSEEESKNLPEGWRIR